MVVRDASPEELLRAIRSGGVVVVDFWAPWCVPCKLTSPQVEAASRVVGSKATFLKFNVDEDPELAAELGILSVPTVIVFRNGEEVERIVGAKRDLHNRIVRIVDGLG